MSQNKYLYYTIPFLRREIAVDRSELMSIVNFWASVYRLPGKCIKKAEQLYSAFLWSGPELKI